MISDAEHAELKNSKYKRCVGKKPEYFHFVYNKCINTSQIQYMQ